MRMHVTYDPEAGAAYVYVGAPRLSERQVELDDDTIADYDDRGDIIGIEFLGVSQPDLEIYHRWDEDEKWRPVRRQQDVKVQGDLL